jgi:hypothetical protein
MTLLVAFTAAAPYISAQSTTSGDISGLVTDPSGAVVPGATVTALNVDNGRSTKTATNSTGSYRFALLPPGNYSVTVGAANFQKATRKVELALGQAPTVDFKLAMQGASEVVEVTAGANAIQTDNGNIATSFTQSQIANIPNPGNDLTYYAMTAPGAVMNTGAGYGNFSTFGLPATSNLFTVNGMNDNDPFFNLNNSGATNLTLGANDVGEATVVNNGYLGEYGGLGGSNVNYVTKSGTNSWHGNLQYFYNDDRLNANSWFNDNSGTPKAFALAQQYAGSIGGPIKKNKAYIFFNAEGLYVGLPTSQVVGVPTPAFEAATLSNLAAQGQAAEIPFYNKMFSLYNNAPITGSLTPIAGGGCGSGLTGAVAAFAASGGQCANQFTSTAGNHTHENMQMGRFDYNIGPNDRAYLHVRRDLGVQATYTDPISPVFNQTSNQPEYDAQLNETHTFGNSSVNQFILSAMYYGATFNVPNVNAALSAMPFTMSFTGGKNGVFYPLGYYNYDANGRNVTQYQIVDDFSHTWKNHDLKFGVNFVRDDVSDWDINQYAQTGTTYSSETLSDFFNGAASYYQQDFVSGGKASVPIATYGLGLYAQDEWRARPNLKLTFALRAEHNSNPVCQTNCFNRFGTSFSQVNPALPDNQTILTNQHQALIGFDAINWQPRFGFAYSPFGASSSLVIRGGFGIFIDKFPAQVADSILFNAPFNNQFYVANSSTNPVSLMGAPAAAAASNATFVNGFASGASVPAVNMTVPAGSLHSPQYQEWNLEIQKAFGKADSLSLNYVGNHGIHETYVAGGVNAYDQAGGISTTDLGGFGGLPLTAPNSNFGTVSEVESNAVSNYNGLTATFVHRFHKLQVQFNYTWSHALDEISNGGLLPFTYLDNQSPQNPQDPFNLRKYNYGNADYDIRHYASASWVWDTPKLQNKVLNAIASWMVSGTLFAHSGTPYTVVDSNVTSALSQQNYGGFMPPYVFGNQLVPGTGSCGSGAATTACAAMLNNFASPTTTWGNQRRNQFFGPGYFNASMTLMKTFAIPHWESGKIAAGAQFFNIFNHPNFDQPIADLGAGSNYGLIHYTVATPTSMYGSFLGADASPRQIQLRATLTF